MLWDINIHKTYPSRDRHFAIDIRFQSDSKRLVLFGPSGAGKTQVLKMLSGLVTPDKGHIQFSNIDLFNSHKHIHLSPQQGQRVALARALIMSPKAVLLDEPFSALDEKLRNNLRQELVDLQTQLSLPMILISHHPDDVRTFGEEIICLSHGQILENPA